MTNAAGNRRRFERLNVPPMYTPVSVRLAGERKFRRDGHSYDLSEGGIQFELDDYIAPGTTVGLRIELPASFGGEADSQREVFVTGNVVWADESEPGPVRLAVAFTKFASEADRDRLLARLRVVIRRRNAA
ncbi:MAG: hypothetical protein HBSAPP03_00820 [Phycisphaerae bacterium]|nr:MAG: hypothetical protein HBSAPP03_00820 [Phycisphaerae bacterium]